MRFQEASLYWGKQLNPENSLIPRGMQNTISPLYQNIRNFFLPISILLIIIIGIYLVNYYIGIILGLIAFILGGAISKILPKTYSKYYYLKIHKVLTTKKNRYKKRNDELRLFATEEIISLLEDVSPDKKKEMNKTVTQIMNSIFPKGKKDINAGTDELLHILNHSINRDEARNIFIKSVSISRISKNFDKERLMEHLSDYCIQHFSQMQIKRFFNYLVALSAAMMMHGKTPSEVRRKGEIYIW